MAEPQLEQLVDSLLAYEVPAEAVAAVLAAELSNVTAIASNDKVVSSLVRTSLLQLHRDVTGQPLEDVPYTPPAHRAHAVTPLICDVSMGEKSLKYFLRTSNKYAVLDAKGMHLDLNVKKMPLAHILESARNKITHAMKTGRILVIRMGDVTVDFLNTFNDTSAVKLTSKQILNKLIMKETSAPYNEKAYLPLDIFCDKGRLLYEETWASKLYSRADREELHHCSPVMKGFAVIVTTTYPEERLDAYVFTGAFGLPPRGLFNISTFR